MKYFLLHTDPQYTTAPDLLDWRDKIDPRYIRKGRSYRLPQRELLLIRENPDTVFTDVLSFPFFLVTQLGKDMICLYEPKTIFKEMVLLDRANQAAEVYHLPILDAVDCLSDQSEWNADRSVLRRGVLRAEKLGKQALFFLDGSKNTYVAARLDLVESLLKRGARGIGLTPLEIVTESLECRQEEQHGQ